MIGCIYVIFSISSRREVISYICKGNQTMHVVTPVAQPLDHDHHKGMTLLFQRLVFSSHASPKRLRISIVMVMSLASGRRNKTTSSAYREIRCCSGHLAKGCSSPSSEALEIMCPRVSMTKMNNIGDKGSSCLSPH
jgi:hypothetical protein